MFYYLKLFLGYNKSLLSHFKKLQPHNKTLNKNKQKQTKILPSSKTKQN